MKSHTGFECFIVGYWVKYWPDCEKRQFCYSNDHKQISRINFRTLSTKLLNNLPVNLGNIDNENSNERNSLRVQTFFMFILFFLNLQGIVGKVIPEDCSFFKKKKKTSYYYYYYCGALQFFSNIRTLDLTDTHVTKRDVSSFNSPPLCLVFDWSFASCFSWAFVIFSVGSIFSLKY